MCNGVKETKAILKAIKKLHESTVHSGSSCLYFIEYPKYALNGSYEYNLGVNNERSDVTTEEHNGGFRY